MEQKRPADIFQEALDYLWNGLGLEEKGWKRLKKGDFKKKTKNGLTYQIWFDRSRYNYICSGAAASEYHYPWTNFFQSVYPDSSNYILL